MQLPDVTVEHLTVRARRDDVATRLAVSRQLGVAEVAPRGVPPASILIVQLLRDPLPHRISANPLVTTLDVHWQDAMRDALTALSQNAARPDRGRIDEKAGALLFRDEAELVACLALHLVRSRGASAWWQQAAARYFCTASASELLRADVQALPSTITMLADWDAVEDVVTCLSETDAIELVVAIAQVHELPAFLELAGSLHPSERAAAGVAPATDRDGVHSESGHGTEARQRATMVAAPPWLRLWTPRRALSPARQLLVGVAVSLVRARPEARSARFARRAVEWLQLANGATSSGGQVRPRQVADLALFRVTQRSESQEPRRRAVAAPDQSPAPGVRPGVDTRLLVSEPETRATRPGRIAMHEGSGARLTVAAHSIAPGEPPAVEGGTRSARDQADYPDRSGRTLKQAPLVDLGGERALMLEGGFDTELGGVFYLLNLLESLRIPACFEREVGLETAVGTWGTLEAVARALLGPLSTERERDPLWQWLGAADDRESGTAPRAEGLRTDTLRLPETWLRQCANELHSASWRCEHEQLVIWANEAFPLVTVPDCMEPVERQVLTELARYRAAGVTLRATPGCGLCSPRLEALRSTGWPAPLVCWLEFVTPYLRYRLGRALGMPEPFDVLEQIVRLSARVHVGDVHVDVVASIESTRVALRIAGLDRSPGWVASVGRVVLLHFQ